MRTLVGLIITLLVGILLVYGTYDFPKWSDPNQPASLHLSPRFIEEANNETAVPNMVTAVLADYRGYDTMFETTVILAAGIGAMMLLRRELYSG
ncbi:MAG: hydrogen gas-evolving membrane-bound hydrogenase subunit E [Spirochaetota bacterium]|nr:hydrogen gas-evolving membrane-bound hydrogenase subunit E [Spirochaetota bacterium]